MLDVEVASRVQHDRTLHKSGRQPARRLARLAQTIQRLLVAENLQITRECDLERTKRLYTNRTSCGDSYNRPAAVDIDARIESS